MKEPTLLKRYLVERDGLLQALLKLLESDPGVVTAWLFGSLGREEADELSDIDLWVVVEDEKIEPLIAEPRQYASRIGNPILFVEAPQNAPRGGAYLMTCYDAPVAPHIVDWYWQPLSLAFIPDQTRLLFDRVGLRYNHLGLQFQGGPANKEIIERPMHFISFFWMMLMITAKYVLRYPKEEQMELLPLLVDPILKARQFLGQDNGYLAQDLPTNSSPSEKIHFLYRLADQMSELMRRVSAEGESVPDLIIPGAYRYLQLIDQTIQVKQTDR